MKRGKSYVRSFIAACVGLAAVAHAQQPVPPLTDAAASEQQAPKGDSTPAAADAKEPPIIQPVVKTRLPKELSFPRSILACPDGTGCLILDVDAAGDRVFKVALADGKVVGKATEIGTQSFQAKFLRAGNLWVLVRTDSGEIVQLDANTGAMVRRIAPSSDSRGCVVNGEGDSIAWGGNEKIGIIDLATGKQTQFAPVDIEQRPLIPIAFTKDILVAGVPDKDKALCFAIDLKSGKTVARTELSLGPLSTSSDGELFASATIKDDGWDRVTVWDSKELKKVADREFKPTISSIGLQLAPKGSFLLVHEYMVQFLFIWNPESGEPVAMLGPGDLSATAFDLSNDGKKVTAMAGTWHNGSLAPEWIATYDLSALIK